MSSDRSYVIQYLRPDGWWEAGRGWTDLAKANRDAAEQLPENCKWRVVLAGSDFDKEAITDD